MIWVCLLSSLHFFIFYIKLLVVGWCIYAHRLKKLSSFGGLKSTTLRPKSVNYFYLYMKHAKKWFEFYSTPEIEFEKVQQLVGQIPWGQNILIMSRSKDREEAIKRIIL